MYYFKEWFPWVSYIRISWFVSFQICPFSYTYISDRYGYWNVLFVPSHERPLEVEAIVKKQTPGGWLFVPTVNRRFLSLLVFFRLRFKFSWFFDAILSNYYNSLYKYGVALEIISIPGAGVRFASTCSAGPDDSCPNRRRQMLFLLRLPELSRWVAVLRVPKRVRVLWWILSVFRFQSRSLFMRKPARKNIYCSA